jgi:head-tail adaptor
MANLARLLHDVGEMDNLINIKSPTQTTDATGGITKTWSSLYTDVWCKVDYSLKSNEGFRSEDQQLVAFRVVTFTMRDFAELNEIMRIEFEDVEYDILSITKLGRDRFLVIEAERRDNNT